MIPYEIIDLKNDYPPLNEGSQIDLNPSFLKCKVKQIQNLNSEDQRFSTNKYFLWSYMRELVTKMTIHPYMRGLRSISTHLFLSGRLSSYGI
jgi:hypothetical protein